MLAMVEASDVAAAVQEVLKPVVDGLWWADDLGEARRLLADQDVSVVVASYTVDEVRATDLFDGAADPPFPLVVLCGSDDQRVDAVEHGAIESLGRSHVAALPHLLRGAVREHGLRERARVAEERLLHANRLIGAGRIAAVTAHEVGTPLNVARMQAQLIAADRPGDAALDASCATIVEQIDVASQRMRALLDFARLGDRGRGPINLGEAVHSAVDLLAPIARRQGVVVQVDGPQLMVRANRSQVQQVVFNLLTNALHAVDGVGEVRVALAPVEREGRAFGTVSVCDDGAGVAEEVRHDLFDAFVTTKSAGRGTGLGLAVCRDIAESHEGWIDLHTEPGRTRLEVGFPRA